MTNDHPSTRVFQQAIYSSHVDRFDSLPWTVDIPPVDADSMFDVVITSTDLLRNANQQSLSLMPFRPFGEVFQFYISLILLCSRTYFITRATRKGDDNLYLFTDEAAISTASAPLYVVLIEEKQHILRSCKSEQYGITYYDWNFRQRQNSFCHTKVAYDFKCRRRLRRSKMIG